MASKDLFVLLAVFSLCFGGLLASAQEADPPSDQAYQANPCDELQNELSLLRQESAARIVELETELIQSKDLVEQYTTYSEKLRQDAETKHSEAAAAQEQLTQLQALFQQEQAGKEELQALLRTEQAQKEELQALSRTEQIQKEELQSRVGTEQAQKGELQALLQTEQAQKSEIQTLFQTEKAQKEELLSLLQSEQTQKEELQALLRAEQTRKEEVQALLEAEQTRKAELQALVEDEQKQTASLQRQKDDLQGAMQLEQKHKTELQALLQQEQKQKQDAHVILQQEQSYRTQAEAKLQAVEQQLTDAQQALTRAEAAKQSDADKALLRLAEESWLPLWAQLRINTMSENVEVLYEELKVGNTSRYGMMAFQTYKGMVHRAGVAQTFVSKKLDEHVPELKAQCLHLADQVRPYFGKAREGLDTYVIKAQWPQELRKQLVQAEVELRTFLTQLLTQSPALAPYADPVLIQGAVYMVFALPVVLVLLPILLLLLPGSRGAAGPKEDPASKKKAGGKKGGAKAGAGKGKGK